MISAVKYFAVPPSTEILLTTCLSFTSYRATSKTYASVYANSLAVAVPVPIKAPVINTI